MKRAFMCFSSVGICLLAIAGQSNAQICASGKICLYNAGNYDEKDGVFKTTAPLINNYTGHNFFGTNRDVNDDVSSLCNKTGKWVVFFRAKLHDQEAICVAPGKCHPRLGDFKFNPICGSPCGSMNDKLSSHKSYSGDPGNVCSPDWRVE